MAVAHIGFAGVVLGAVVVTQQNVERDLRMAVGDQQELGGYRFEMLSVGQQGPKLSCGSGGLRSDSGRTARGDADPREGRYFASGQIMTEAAIDASIWRDLYIALGEPIGEDAWAVRLQYKPMVRWLWLGALMIGLGALLTVADRRYRTQVQRRDAPVVGWQALRQTVRPAAGVCASGRAPLQRVVYRPHCATGRESGSTVSVFYSAGTDKRSRDHRAVTVTGTRTGQCLGHVVLFLSSRASLPVGSGGAGRADLRAQLQR